MCQERPDHPHRLVRQCDCGHIGVAPREEPGEPLVGRVAPAPGPALTWTFPGLQGVFCSGKEEGTACLHSVFVCGVVGR